MNKRSDDMPREPSDATCEVDAVDAQAVAAARDGMPPERRIQSMAETFGALGDPTRLRILQALATRELCVCDLAAITGVTQSAVSHQLRTLRQLDLVAFTREGKRAVYRLADDHVRTMLAQGAEHVAERTGGHGDG